MAHCWLGSVLCKFSLLRPLLPLLQSSGHQRRMAVPSFRVLTLNTWVGDYRRGYCSRDAERLRMM